jgi:hypothetical protein
MSKQLISRSRKALVGLIVGVVALALSGTASAQLVEVARSPAEANHHFVTVYHETALGHLKALDYLLRGFIAARAAVDHEMLIEHTEAVAAALRGAARHLDAADRAMTVAQRTSNNALLTRIRAAYADALREQQSVEVEARRPTPDASVLAEHTTAEHAAVFRAHDAEGQLKRSLSVREAPTPPAPTAHHAAAPTAPTAHHAAAH